MALPERNVLSGRERESLPLVMFDNGLRTAVAR